MSLVSTILAATDVSADGGISGNYYINAVCLSRAASAILYTNALAWVVPAGSNFHKLCVRTISFVGWFVAAVIPIHHNPHVDFLAAWKAWLMVVGVERLISAFYVYKPTIRNAMSKAEFSFAQGYLLYSTVVGVLIFPVMFACWPVVALLINPIYVHFGF